MLYAKLQIGKSQIIYLDDNQDYQASLTEPVFIVGGENSKVKGSFYNDVVFGGSGNYEIETGLGRDTLMAGNGNGVLKGGLGNDVYIYAKGSEEVRIYDDAGQDILKLKGIGLKDVVLKKEHNDLVIKFVENEKDKITVKDQFAWKIGYFNQIEKIEFDDGAYLTANKINAVIKVHEQYSYGTSLYDAGKIYEELSQQSLIGYI